MLFDEVLIELGEFNKYQIRSLFITQYLSFCLGFGVTMLPVFILATPEHRCAIPGVNDTWRVQDEDHERLINQTIPLGSKCTFYDTNGTEKECNQWVYNDEIFKPSAVMEFNIVCHRKFFRATINMVYFFGMIFGGLVGGRLSDRFGRKIVMYVTIFPFMIVSLSLGFSANIYMLMACRCLQSASLMAYYAAAFVFLLEITGPSKRQAIAPLTDVLFVAGYVLMALPAYFIRNWRYQALTGSLFQLPLLSLWWFIPESPRWLLTRNRKEEANKIIQNIARVNGKKIDENILDDVDLQSKTKHDGSFWKLFKYKSTCVRLLILCISWCAAATVYYGLSLNAGNLAGNIFVNFVLSAAIDWPAAAFIMFAPVKFGRKKSHAFVFLLGGTACLATILVVLFGKNGAVTWAYQLLATIGKFGAAAAFSSVYSFTAELHPTTSRTLSLGFCSMCARIASLCAPFVSDLGSYISGRFSVAMPLIVFGALSVVAGLTSLFLPETYNMPLPANIEEARHFGRRSITPKEDGKAAEEKSTKV